MEYYNFETQKPELQSKTSEIKVCGFVIKLLLEYPFSVAAVVVLSIIAALSELMSIALLLPFVDSLRDNTTSSLADRTPIGFLAPYFEGLSLVAKIRIIAVSLLVVELVKAASRYLAGRRSQLLRVNIDSSVRMKVYDQLHHVGLGFIHKEKLANLFTILNNYTGGVSQTALLIASLVPDLFLTLISFSILLSISVPMTIIAIVLGLITTLILGRLTKYARVLGMLANRASVSMNHISFELLSGMGLIRMFAREKAARKRFKTSLQDWQNVNYKRGLLESAITPLATIMLAFIVVVLLVAATFVMHREAEFWMGILVIFLVVFSRVGGPLGRINLVRAQIAASIPAIQSVIEFLFRTDTQHIPEGNIEFDVLKESIRLENVSFRYDSREEEVLANVNFIIPKGKVTAIVGGSGAGKSTLIAILCRLYDPTEGQILVDGTDLRDFKSKTWRCRLGVVTQSTFLFNDTLRNNIAFAKPDATDTEIEQVARNANAHQFIMEMRDGYQTLVGDRGVRLSGGQAQRVAIARAILVDPDLLLLDEATSALDTVSERLVQEAIDRVSRDRTVVVVAHRLSTIRDADNIVVLEKGRVVEQGTHQELIARQGSYWKYVQLQDLGLQGKSPPPQMDRDESALSGFTEND